MKVFNIILILFSFQSLCAQTFEIQYYGIENGLLSREITCINQDQLGYIWLGTAGGGLFRYDGFNFTRYLVGDKNIKLGSNQINDIYAARNGELWVCGNGITIINPKSMSSYLLYSGESKDENFFFKFIDGYNGEIWGSDERGIFKVKDNDLNQIERILYLNDNEYAFKYLLKDKKGKIWFTNLNKLYCIEGNEQINLVYHYKNKLDWRYIFIPIINFKGNIIGIQKYENDYFYPLEKLNNGTPSFPDESINWNFFKKHYPHFESKVNDLIVYLKRGEFKTYETKDNTIWVGAEAGLFKINSINKVFTTCNNLENTSIRGFFEDPKSHNIYIGTYKGLFEYNPKLNKAKKITNDVAYKIIYKKGSQLLVLTENIGLQWWNLSTRKTQQITTPYSNNSASRGVYLDNNTVYFSQKGIIYEYNLVKEIVASSKIVLPDLVDPLNTEINAIFKDSNNDFWVSTNDRVFCFNQNGKVKNTSILNDSLLNQNSQVLEFYEDSQKQLWLTSKRFGLIKLDLNRHEIQCFSTKQGLSHNECYGVLSSDGGKSFWISTANGINKFNVDEQKFKIYYEKSGIANNEFNRCSFFKSSDNIFYFGGINGITFFNPAKIQEKQINVEPLITNYTIYNQNSDIKRVSDIGQLPNNIVLEANDNIIEFELSCTDFSDPSNNNFMYYLDGFDRQWNSISHYNKIRCMNLPAGHYTLLVKAIGGQGEESTKIVELPIIVKPFFYKTVWFTTLVVFLIIAALFAIVRLRLKQIKKENNIRLNISSNIHDKLGGMLYLINTTAYEIKNDESIDQNKIEQLTTLCQKAYQSMSELIWTINPDNQYFSKIIMKMDDDAIQILGKYYTLTTFYTNVSQKDKQIKLDISHHIIMIYKEALINIVKHTIPTKIEIKIELASKLKLEIINYFLIKKTTPLSGGNGIHSIKQRVKAIGAQVHIVKDTNSFRLTVTSNKSI